MFKFTVLSVLAHHGEAADPDLLEWIKGVLDHVVGGPWVAVAVLALLMLAIPVAIVVFYLVQQRRSRSGARQTAGPFTSA